MQTIYEEKRKKTVSSQSNIKTTGNIVKINYVIYYMNKHIFIEQ